MSVLGLVRGFFDWLFSPTCSDIQKGYGTNVPYKTYCDDTLGIFAGIVLGFLLLLLTILFFGGLVYIIDSLRIRGTRK